jgi:hypothetical protein
MTPSIHYLHRRAPKAASAAGAVADMYKTLGGEYRRQHSRRLPTQLAIRVSVTQLLSAVAERRKRKFQAVAFALFERLKTV